MNKKLLFFLFFSGIALSILAQNPDNWSLDGGAISWLQETTTVNTGTYSCGITWISTDTQYLNADSVDVTEGAVINASIKVYDNDASGRARLCIIYDSGTNVYNTYSSDGTTWEDLSYSGTVPTGATKAMLQIRFYDVTGWDGDATIYIDDVSLDINSGANLVSNPGFENWTIPAYIPINSAYSISTDEVDVVYQSAVSSVDATDYLLRGTGDITFTTATIDGTDSKVVHLSGPSASIASDILIDTILDANSKSSFYAGILPVSYTNKLNPSGTISKDTIATFQGIVSANDAYNGVWVSDAAGAYNGVYIYSSTFDGEANVGDDIIFTAVLDEYNNITELTSPVLVQKISTGNTPYGPSIITGSDIAETILANTNPAESWEGQLVKIVDVTITGTKDASNYYYPATDDGSTIFRIGDNVDYKLNNIPLVENDHVTITGVVDYEDGAYRINPRSALDIVSSSDTVTSAEYTVNNVAGTITNVAYTTTLATFKSNITASDSATFNVFDADGTTPATTLDDTKLLIVLAADGITTKTYAITRNAISTVASVTSTVYTVDDGGATITNVPFGTDLATFESNITPPPYGTFETYESNGSTVATDLQSGYIVKGVAEDGTTSKSYTLTINAAPLDNDSYAEAPATQVAAGTIVITDADGKDEAAPVFSFKIVDPGTSDGEPTNVSQLVIYYGPNNTMDFETDIDSGYFDVDGTPIDLGGEPVFGTDSVAFPIAADQIVVPDGGSVTVTMNLNLAPHATEDAVMQFMVAADPHGFEALVTGSGFAPAFSGDITGNNLTIDAVATELRFVQQPTSVFVNDTIKPAVVVAAVDANGNTDKDYATDISITCAGADLLYSPHVVTPVDGIATFDTLIFSTLGTGVTLTATSGALLEVSNNFVVAEVSNLDLYFSEYVDGSSFNKAIEIYNPTGMEVSLDNYFMKGSSNDASDWESDYDFPDTAIIQPYDVFVIANPSASEEIKKLADMTDGYITGYNGNDARGLFKVVGKDTILLDLLGTPNNPNKLYYEVAGIERAMDGHTIVRKPSINQGNTDWAASAGTNEDNSEWIVLEEDNIDDLGNRTLEGGSGTEILTFSIPGFTVDTATHIVSEKDSIAITVVHTAQLDSLFPVFTLSSGATSTPSSGDSVDFSTGKASISVTSQDMMHSQNWTVYVVEQLSEILTGNDIIGFEVPDQAGESIINVASKTVTAYVDYGTDLSKLATVITLSAGATSVPESGDTLDFSDTVSVAVTAEDGSMATWKLVVKENIVEVTNLAAARALMGTTAAIKITGEVVLTGQMSSSGKMKYYIQDGTAGILIFDASGTITTTYSLGDGMTGLIGTLTDYNGVMELVPLSDPGNATSTGNVVEPQVLTIAELKANFDNYESELIKIARIKFTDKGSDFANSKNYTISLEGDTMVCRTDFNGTDLIGTEIPDSADVMGIAAEYNGTIEIFPRFLADVKNLDPASLSNDASLSDLKVDGVSVVGFNAAFMSYEITLAPGTTSIPVVTYTTRDENATVVVENATDLQGDVDARTTNVIVTAEDGTTTRTYNVLFNIGGTGLDNVLFSQVSFYPNPVHTRLAITHTDLIESITLLNITGKQISATNVDGRSVVEFDVSDLPGGLYIIQLRSDNKVKNLKFIKE